EVELADQLVIGGGHHPNDLLTDRLARRCDPAGVVSASGDSCCGRHSSSPVSYWSSRFTLSSSALGKPGAVSAFSPPRIRPTLPCASRSRRCCSYSACSTTSRLNSIRPW